MLGSTKDYKDVVLNPKSNWMVVVVVSKLF